MRPPLNSYGTPTVIDPSPVGGGQGEAVNGPLHSSTPVTTHAQCHQGDKVPIVLNK